MPQAKLPDSSDTLGQFFVDFELALGQPFIEFQLVFMERASRPGRYNQPDHGYDPRNAGSDDGRPKERSKIHVSFHLK
jgi:hypothetical protein